MATDFIGRGRSILNKYWLGRHWLWCGFQISAFLTPAISASLSSASCCCVSTTLVPFLIRGWCDLGSACAQSDQSLNFMLMIFLNSWIDMCKRQLWSVCSALIQYKNPAGTWRQNDIILTYIRRHYVAYLSVRRRYDVMCLLGRFNAHFAEIYNQAILITQARDLNSESNIQWEKTQVSEYREIFNGLKSILSQWQMVYF